MMIIYKRERCGNIRGKRDLLYNLLMYPVFFNRFNQHDFAISGYRKKKKLSGKPIS